MAVNLTDGAIPAIATGEAQATGVRPVLQVFDIRIVNTQNNNNNGTERYRLLLSDGIYYQQGMLATQRNELVRSGRLQKGSIVMLNEFVCNVIQSRMIIIIIDLDVIVENCDIIGDPKQYPPKAENETAPVSRPSAPAHSSMNQPGIGSGNPQPSAGNSFSSVSRANVGGGTHTQAPEMERSLGPGSYNSSFSAKPESGRFNATNVPPAYTRTESGAGISRPPLSNNVRPFQSSAYPQPPPMYANRGPIAKNEAPPRIIPIAALNPYQGRWTIKARVTAKGELRHYSNQRGEGKVFSFDLLDSDGGEIRVTCFNAVADQFYHQIEVGRVYLISKGSLKPAQKNFNHLRNDHEIFLESTSTIQLCSEEDNSIPQQQFHFRPIIEIEGMESNSIVDVIGVVCSISPSSLIMRKNGTETHKRTLHLKDMSGRSVEVTLWGNFCNAEGQTLQNICDSGVFPVLAVKAGRVNDFNGKTVGTISSSQLLIDLDCPEARNLKRWIENEGKNAPIVSISKETTSLGRTDVRKSVSQIKDEKLGTSEKPDWITICATLSYIKTDNFCYTACPIMIGDRKCSKKVTNNGDGKWRCERCDQSVDECDYRYILQLQMQDHTGLTWATAFQECGEEIMGISAKELFYMKYEEQDDERFAEVMHNALFNKYTFKLKVKEETFSDEQRVKSTVVKAEKLNYISETRFLLDLIGNPRGEDSFSVAAKAENVFSSTGPSSSGYGIPGSREAPANFSGNASTVGQGPTSQVSAYGNMNTASRFASTSASGVYMSCNNCGGNGHSSTNCPNVTSGVGHAYAGGFNNRTPAAGGGGGATGECFKCHQTGHWARDCPGTGNVHQGYGSGGNVTPGRYGGGSRQYVGGF